MSHSHGTAFYWSHAGAHFNMQDEGDWCASYLISALACHLQAQARCKASKGFMWIS